MLSLKNALKQEHNEIRTRFNSPLCWIYKNQYSIHLTHWLSLFPRQNIKIIIFEEWLNNRVILDHEVMQFLGLDNFYFERSAQKTYSIKSIKNKYTQGFLKHLSRPNKMNKKRRQIIAFYIANDIKKTEHLLNKNLDIWKKHDI